MAAKKKSRLAFPLGMLIIIFAVVGIVATVKWGVTAVKTLTDNSAQKKEYEEFLRPVVMYDPDPFDDVNSADLTQLVNASIWSLITQSDSSESFSYSTGDNMGILIPEKRVTAEFVRLFGTEIDIASKYSSLNMSAHDITYDAAQGGFIIPITSLDIAYTPEVYEIEKKANSIILTVGYIGSKAWAEIEDGGYASPQADKYMKITLRQGEKGYYIASLQAIGASEVANISTTAPVSAVSQSTPGIASDEQISAMNNGVTEKSEYETVTDENGEAVTDENGEVVTEEVTEETTSEAEEKETTAESDE